MGWKLLIPMLLRTVVETDLSETKTLEVRTLLWWFMHGFRQIQMRHVLQHKYATYIRPKMVSRKLRLFNRSTIGTYTKIRNLYITLKKQNAENNAFIVDNLAEPNFLLELSPTDQQDLNSIVLSQPLEPNSNNSMAKDFDSTLTEEATMVSWHNNNTFAPGAHQKIKTIKIH